MGRSLYVAALSLLLLSACGDASPSTVQFGVVDSNATLSNDAQQLAGDLSAGAAALFKQLEGPGNLVFSPFAVQEAVGMMYLAAQDATATDIANELSWSLDPNSIGPAYANLTSVIATSVAGGNTLLETGTRVWSNASNVLLSDFSPAVESAFGASVVPVNIENNPGAVVSEINQWVAQQTHNQLTSLVSSAALNSATLVQTAALCVSGPWQSAFSRDSNAATTFYAGQGNTVQVAMIQATDTFNYGATSQYQAVDLVYQGNALSMLLVMPSDSVSSFTNNMDGNTVADILSNLYPTQIELGFPVFSTASNPNMMTTLTALGMKLANTAAAQFDVYKNANATMGAILEQAVVSVDEHGTGTTASSGGTNSGGSSGGPSDTFLVNYPFVYFIHDLATNSILLMGQVTDPTSKS